LQIQQLLYAIAVADTLSFSKAAQALYVTQPTLSQQIRKLEQLVGFPVFRRSTKGVVLTEHGARFIEQARRGAAEYRELQRAVEKTSLLQSGSITVGFPPLLDADNRRLIEILASFSQKYQNIRFEFIQSQSTALIEKILLGEIDIALIQEDSAPESIDLFPFREDHVVLLTDRSNPLAQKNTISLGELRGEKILFNSRQSSMQQLLEEYFRRQRIAPNFAYISGDTNAVNTLIANGFGVSFSTSESDVKHAVGSLLAIPLEPQVRRRISVASGKSTRLSPTVRSCLSYVVSRITQGTGNEGQRGAG